MHNAVSTRPAVVYHSSKSSAPIAAKTRLKIEIAFGETRARTSAPARKRAQPVEREVSGLRLSTPNARSCSSVFCRERTIVPALLQSYERMSTG